jgi:hypothetical protein
VHYLKLNFTKAKIAMIVAVVIGVGLAGTLLTFNFSGSSSAYVLVPGGVTPPPGAVGWISENTYVSPVYEIKPGQIVEHKIRYEKASSSDLITVNLLIKDVEQEGIIEHYINGEKIGSNWVGKDIIEEEEAVVYCTVCGALPWMGPPQEEVIQTVKSISYQGKFQFVLEVLIEEPN